MVESLYVGGFSSATGLVCVVVCWVIGRGGSCFGVLGGFYALTFWV